MALLDATNRARTVAQWMRENIETCSFNKADLTAALAATDAWIDGNQNSFNTALPVAFRNNASLTQKTLLFCFVAMRRAGRLKTSEDS